jgi:hypothetical protein
MDNNVQKEKIIYIIIYNYNNHGSTALYGFGPPLSEVTWSCAFVAVSDQPTGRAVRHLAVSQAAEFCLRTLLVLFMP